MGFSDSAFYIAWDAVMLVLSLPAAWFARKVRWEYKGKKDQMRTTALLITCLLFPLTFIFELASDAYIYYSKEDSIAAYESTLSGLNIMGQLFQLTMLLTTAFIFFRTAVAMLYSQSRGQKLGLTRNVEIVSAIGFVAIVILAAVVWGLYIQYNLRLKEWFDALVADPDANSNGGPEYWALNAAFKRETKIGIAYEWIYFAFASIFLPIAVMQVIGRRTDRIAILLFVSAILLVDVMHVLEVVRNLVSINKNDPLGAQSKFDTGIQITVVIANSLFELLAIYCLIMMGMRDPKWLSGEDEPVFQPVSQYPNESKWPQDTKYDPAGEISGPHAAELPTAENGLLEEGHGAQELPGEEVESSSKTSSKFSKFLKRG